MDALRFCVGVSAFGGFFCLDGLLAGLLAGKVGRLEVLSG
jgi:hypothetical protein